MSLPEISSYNISIIAFSVPSNQEISKELPKKHKCTAQLYRLTAPIALHPDANDSIENTDLDPLELVAHSDSRLKENKHEPMEVVGFSVKSYSEATSPESFLQMLCDRMCAMMNR